MRKITVTILALSLAGCASQPKPSIMHSAPVKAAKHPDPCPCSPTANQVVKKRWFSGYKVKLFH